MYNFSRTRITEDLTTMELEDIFNTLKKMDKKDPLVKASFHAVAYELTARSL